MPVTGNGVIGLGTNMLNKVTKEEVVAIHAQIHATNHVVRIVEDLNTDIK